MKKGNRQSIKSKVIVIDLSGVFFSDGRKIAIKRISKKYHRTKEEIDSIFYGPFSKNYRAGLIEPQGHWPKVKRILKLKSATEIKNIFFNSYWPKKTAITLVKKWRGQGLRVGFLSNAPKDRTEYLEKKYCFLKYFDFGLFSFQAKCLKPDKKIYQKFLKRFSLRPSEIIFIDDRQDNLDAAKKLGIKTILFRSIRAL